jgi:hypothetical protein
MLLMTVMKSFLIYGAGSGEENLSVVEYIRNLSRNLPRLDPRTDHDSIYNETESVNNSILSKEKHTINYGS